MVLSSLATLQKKNRDASLATRGDKAYPARWCRKHRGTVAIRTPLTVEVLYGFIVEILTQLLCVTNYYVLPYVTIVYKHRFQA